LLPLLPLLPLFPSPLTWNPPCCDRIRPLLPWVARKLTLAFPPSAHLAPPHPKSRPPGVSQIQNRRHSLGQHCEPNPYARLQSQRPAVCFLFVSYLFIYTYLAQMLTNFCFPQLNIFCLAEFIKDNRREAQFP
jgi:hypothetical protein